jgi:hypothetical protein
VTKVLSAIRAIVSFLVRYPKEALIILLCLLLMFMNWQVRMERRISQELSAKTASLPAGTEEIVTVWRDRVVTQWRDGPTKIEYRDRYLPPEGKVEFVTKDKAQDQPPEIRIKDYGFTFRPGGGMVYCDRLLLEADAKFAYWKRYSALIGVTQDFGGLGLSRHVDDFLPFQNLELQGDAGLSWQGRLRLAIGLRMNF